MNIGWNDDFPGKENKVGKEEKKYLFRWKNVVL